MGNEEIMMYNGSLKIKIHILVVGIKEKQLNKTRAPIKLIGNK